MRGGVERDAWPLLLCIPAAVLSYGRGTFLQLFSKQPGNQWLCSATPR